MFRRRRRRRRGGLLLPIVCIALVTAGGCLLYTAAAHPERITGLLHPGREDNVSAFADEDVDDGTLADQTADDSRKDDIATGGEPTATLVPEDAEANVYQTFAYYIPALYDDYVSYSALHPTWQADEIVWRVNAGLHRTMYEDATIITDPNPLLVNPYNQLPDDFVPQALVEVDDFGRLATPEAHDAFLRMRAAIRQDGMDIAVQSAYRTIEYQRGLYERSQKNGAVAVPGFSEHHTGRALDLWGPDGLMDQDGTQTAEGLWVATHAHEYGFIVRYQAETTEITGYIAEPWHITYVGEPIAQAMHDQNIKSLEEYVAKNADAALP